MRTTQDKIQATYEFEKAVYEKLPVEERDTMTLIEFIQSRWEPTPEEQEAI